MTDLLDGALPPVTLGDQIRCVERELKLRKGAYPRWVGDGRMTSGRAAEEIRRMEAVLATLQALEEDS